MREVCHTLGMTNLLDGISRPAYSLHVWLSQDHGVVLVGALLVLTTSVLFTRRNPPTPLTTACES
jgi:hypothetical protein